MARSRIPQGLDRPVVGVVAADPGNPGPLGLAVGRFDGTPVSWQGSALSTVMTRWLGDAVVACCNPGERLVFVCESTAYGARVARALGFAGGAVESTLIDLNAIEPGTRLDVPANVWRRRLGIEAPRDLNKTRRRKSLKLQALELARGYDAEIDASELDRAEALGVYRYAVLIRDRWTTEDVDG